MSSTFYHLYLSVELRLDISPVLYTTYEFNKFYDYDREDADFEQGY